MKTLIFAAAAAFLLARPSFAQYGAEDGPVGIHTGQDQVQPAEPGEGGTSQKGMKLKPVSFSSPAGKTKTAAGQEEKAPVAGRLDAPCRLEDLDWNPGKGGPATTVQGQALRAQREDTTTSYRVRASQIGKRGNFGFASDITHADTFMRLTNNPCEVTLKLGACEINYGVVTLWYRTGGKPSTRFGDCLLPKPAGKYLGEDYWWLNVHTRGPCGGGRGWWGGVKTQDGECTRAIVYQSDDAALNPVTTPGGTGQTGGTGSGVDESKDCWTAPSGRTCCKVMFSPVPAECQRR